MRSAPKYFLNLLTALVMCACSNKIDLDMQQISTHSTPFIECYCEVGDLYNLAATYLSPIDQPQNLDYSHKFKVYITDTEEHRLLQGLFSRNNFIYSHGSPASLPLDFDGELKLRVIAEDGTTYLASSTIPDPVEIASATYENGVVELSFDSSDDSAQNYFAVSIAAHYDEGEAIVRRAALKNPEVGESSRIEFEVGEFSSVDISLLRLNREGYQYLYTLVENEESLGSNLVGGVPMSGNIDGAVGIFTAYSRCRKSLQYK